MFGIDSAPGSDISALMKRREENSRCELGREQDARPEMSFMQGRMKRLTRRYHSSDPTHPSSRQEETK